MQSWGKCPLCEAISASIGKCNWGEILSLLNNFFISFTQRFINTNLAVGPISGLLQRLHLRTTTSSGHEIGSGIALDTIYTLGWHLHHRRSTPSARWTQGRFEINPTKFGHVSHWMAAALSLFGRGILRSMARLGLSKRLLAMGYAQRTELHCTWTILWSREMRCQIDSLWNQSFQTRNSSDPKKLDAVALASANI